MNAVSEKTSFKTMRYSELYGNIETLAEKTRAPFIRKWLTSNRLACSGTQRDARSTKDNASRTICGFKTYDQPEYRRKLWLYRFLSLVWEHTPMELV